MAAPRETAIESNTTDEVDNVYANACYNNLGASKQISRDIGKRECEITMLYSPDFQANFWVRGHDDTYVYEPPRPKKTLQSPLSFRFLDLPAELRLQIAEYALADDKSLRWSWLTYKPTKVVGTFDRLDTVTALCRVSRKLQMEFATIVWKVNEFVFDGYHMDKERCALRSRNRPAVFKWVEEAYRVFSSKASTQTLQAIRSVTFYLAYDGTPAFRHEFLCSIDVLAQIIPQVQLRVVSEPWRLVTDSGIHIFGFDTRETEYRGFLIKGRRNVSELNETVFRSGRNWKMFPIIIARNQVWLKQRAQDGNEGAALACEWLNNGI